MSSSSPSSSTRIKIEVSSSSSKSNNDGGTSSSNDNSHNHNHQKKHHERQQVKIAVLLIASLMVLSGTMKYQRDFQQTMMQGQQISWGTDTGSSTSSNFEASSYQALNATTTTTTTAAGGGTPDLLDRNADSSINETKKDSTQRDDVKTEPPPPLPPPPQNVTTEDSSDPPSDNTTSAIAANATTSTINSTSTIATASNITAASDTVDMNIIMKSSNNTTTNETNTRKETRKEKRIRRKKNTATTSKVTTKTPLFNPNSTANLRPFKRYDRVVIATKIHGPHQHFLLDQSLCLLQAAYNRKVNYDIVVFYTEELHDEQMNVTESLVYPAKIIWAKDNKGLQEEIDALSPIRRRNFLKGCNTTNVTEIDWFSNCPERIAYNWQAEFRSWHIWTHEALKPYRTMLWLDTDGFSTHEWPMDPIETMIENDLNILFMNFPQGHGKGHEIHDRMFNSLNKTICHLGITNGRLDVRYGDSADSCPKTQVPMIHGFFHITNLDFYRRPDVLKFEETWIGDGFCQRKFDDQFAVTAPAAILTPDKAWDMHSNGIKLDVYHNGNLDGKRSRKAGGYLKYWKTTVEKQFPEAVEKCEAYIKAGNR